MNLRNNISSSFDRLTKKKNNRKRGEDDQICTTLKIVKADEPSVPSCIDVVEVNTMMGSSGATGRSSGSSIQQRGRSDARTRRRSSEIPRRQGSLAIKQAALEELERSEEQLDAFENDPNMARARAGERTKAQFIVGPTDTKPQPSYWHLLAIQTSNKDTPPNELVRRGAFMLMSSLTCGAGLIWASLYYFILNEPQAALNPTIYSALMTLCFVFLTSEGQYENIVFLQLLLILVLPISMQLSVGGIVRGGAVIIWSFLCPFGAALFCHHSIAKRWFAVYLLSMICTLLNEFTYETSENNPNFALLGGKEIGLFIMNIGGAMTITFFGALAFSIKLDEEFSRSEDLLLNILPKSIAKRLKMGEVHIIDNIDAVTILFADLVGFTKASAELHPNFLIGMVLRDVFCAWDQLSQRRSVEKIKTIGDAYMCVGGLDEEETNKCGMKRTRHLVAYEMVMLGLEMKRALDSVNAKHGTEFQVRVGVHTGPCIAGVIGVKRFAFDIWGDAVNIASRMESHGVPGQIHISSDTYDKIKHLSYLNFQCQGETMVKGKGHMTTYLVDLCQDHRKAPMSRFSHESLETIDRLFEDDNSDNPNWSLGTKGS